MTDDTANAPPDVWSALVVEDDPDAGAFARTVLEKRAGMRVVVAADADAALAALRAEHFDLVVIDVELPGRSGLQILPEVHRLAAGVPVIILTAHNRVDYAVGALRGDVDDFLVKPVDVGLLASRATMLVRRGRQRREENRTKTVLAVGAHPDDVEIGVGGTLAAHASAGDQLVILTLSGGSLGGDPEARHKESRAAAEIVGAQLIALGFEDSHLDPASGPITAVEEVVREVGPDQVYTHSNHDRHQDHRAVHQAVQVATREVRDLACFQSPSSTVDYRPNRFVDIAEHLETKLAMLRAFESQSHRDYLAEDLVRATARYWARFTTGRYAEPLETVRSTLRLPHAPGGLPGDPGHG
ncbi:PIG-L family deacetylase [Promicromonospora panici]|uniref:PIG-L family deacetylase n=1 Tax=Promicromonospora panici TaxID=2219658 RepID=UPI00101DD72E|nr:PIG-L family deacetylase [Promicromonospora panici]